ncbi:MAG: ATP-binding protein [Parvibaculum sp.]|nr:ATP-binding protein [Parvibaculum sp.]
MTNDLTTNDSTQTKESARSGEDVAFDAVVAYAERLAHDANNYIGAILGLSEVLPAVADDAEQVNAIAGRIAAAGRLLQVVVNQALLPGSYHHDAPVLDMETARETVTRLATHLIGTRISFSLTPITSSKALALTQGEFSILLFILLRNACDAADISDGAHAHIRVALEEVSADEMAAEIHTQTFMRGTMPAGNAIALRVYDNGCGFIEALKANAASAFQPFVTRSRRKTALGLGLTFAVAIVERRGGALGVARQEETCFTAYLPVNDRVPDTLNSSDSEESAPQVVIVDPLVQWGAATATLLGLLDWPARQVATISEATGILERASRARHVVVVRLPRGGFGHEDAVALHAIFNKRFNVDLLLVVGAINACAASDATALLMANMAAMPLGADAAPADIVNYLIPNI